MHVAVTAIGKDRPGIIAAVSKVLLDAGGNIEDSRSAILGGHFAMMLIVATDAAPQDLETALSESTKHLDLIVSVKRVEETQSGVPEGEPYVLSVYGADHPGIVYRITDALSSRNVNVGDLTTRVIEGNPPVYMMLMELSLPETLNASTLESDLKALASELGVDLSLRSADADTL
ncbi:MAG: glycine cleavage system transcriptional repressor [Actinomycetota bacterium]